MLRILFIRIITLFLLKSGKVWWPLHGISFGLICMFNMKVIWFQFRFLHLILYLAERAWSHAMEKRQLPNGPNARQRIYLIGRLQKAVKWATLFSQLCTVKADSRTSLEAEVCLLVSYCN